MKGKMPIIFFIILTLLLVLIVVFLDNTSITLFDTWFYNKTAENMNPSLTLAMRFITESGSSMALIVFCLSLFLFTKTRKHWAFPVSFTIIIVTLSNLFLKLVFERERPDILRIINETDYSFPSGHAMINMSFYTMLLLLTWQHIKNKKAKYGIASICIIMPLLIGFSRIYLGVHYATDVLAGWLLGSVIAIIIFNFFDKKNREV